MKSPFFSVIIPTFNRLALLKETVSSVLSQKFPDFEVIVVDNCSTDGTDEFMFSLIENDRRVQYVRNESNHERSYSRNKGLACAVGKFCTLLDSDDIMYADCLEKASKFISDNPSILFFHGLHTIIDEAGRVKKEVALEPLINPNKQICQGNFISCIGVFMGEEIYKNCRFSEDKRMIGSEDYEIWLRVMVEHPIHRLPYVLCGMREHLGRSVYTEMYLNLEFQRKYIIESIKNDPRMNDSYKPYLRHINSNFYYHLAMYFFYNSKTTIGVNFLYHAITSSPDLLFKRRFAAMLKAFFGSLVKE